MPNFDTNLLDFEKFLVTEYFRLGSINKVFYFHHFNLPISYAGFDRVLTKYRVVKSAGPNSKLTESLKILSLVADYKLSLEKIYEKYAPHNLWVSTNTLHRILHYTRLGLTRRQGTALLITQKGNPNYFLVGNDQSLTNPALGQKGDISLPMGHSKVGEKPGDSIARVLQQEVFTNQIVEQRFPWNTVPAHPKPIMYMNIADIRVSVYHLQIPKSPFSSFKLNHIRFVQMSDLVGKNMRPGIEDILRNYYHPSVSSSKIPEFNSSLNSLLYSVVEEKK